MQHIRARELADWLADAKRQPPALLDVREDWEVELCCLPGSKHVAMQRVPESLDELDRAADLVIVCHHGMRSMQVAMFLERQGFQSVYNLSGGIEGWAAEVDPSMRRY